MPSPKLRCMNLSLTSQSKAVWKRNSEEAKMKKKLKAEFTNGCKAVKNCYETANVFTANSWTVKRCCMWHWSKLSVTVALPHHIFSSFTREPLSYEFEIKGEGEKDKRRWEGDWVLIIFWKILRLVTISDWSERPLRGVRGKVSSIIVPHGAVSEAGNWVSAASVAFCVAGAALSKTL